MSLRDPNNGMTVDERFHFEKTRGFLTPLFGNPYPPSSTLNPWCTPGKKLRPRTLGSESEVTVLKADSNIVLVAGKRSWWAIATYIVNSYWEPVMSTFETWMRSLKVGDRVVRTGYYGDTSLQASLDDWEIQHVTDVLADGVYLSGGVFYPYAKEGISKGGALRITGPERPSIPVAKFPTFQEWLASLKVGDRVLRVYKDARSVTTGNYSIRNVLVTKVTDTEIEYNGIFRMDKRTGNGKVFAIRPLWAAQGPVSL